MVLPALPALLSNKFVLYGVILAVVASVSFIGGCQHGAAGKKEIEDEFKAYKTAQALIVKGIQDSAKQDALTANQQLRNQERVLEENERKQKQELSKLRKKLDAVQLDAALVRLLNESVLRGRQDESATGPPQQADGGTHEGPGTGQGVRVPTLGDLAEVTLENNKNHLACIAQVEAWQQFYLKLYDKFE